MRLRSFILVLVTVLLMVGCAGLGASAEAKFDPPVEITLVRSNSGSSFNFEGENVDYDNNVWTKELLERYGIIARNLWVVDAAQYGTRWNLSLASGEMPDAVMVFKNDLAQLIEDDLLMDLTDLYANAPERVKRYSETIEPIAFANATRDGKLYGIPTIPNGNEAQQVIFLRKDWLDNLGLEVPKTMQELIEIARAFAKDDPDQNGVADTFGFPMRDGIYNTLDQTGFFNSFGAYPDFYLEKDGKLVFGTIEPEMKEALAMLQQLYAEGVINPEFGTSTSTEIRAAIADSKLGIYYHYYWGGLHIANSATNNPKAEWICLPVPSMTDEPAKVQSKISDAHYIVINKDCKNPEAVLMMADLFAEHFLEATTDEEFNRYVNDVNGNPVWEYCAPIIRMDYAERSVEIHKQIVAVLKGEMQEADMLAEARGVLGRIRSYLDGDKTLYGWNIIYNDEGALYWNDYYNQNDLTVYNKFVGAATETQLAKGSILDKILQTAFTDIIKGADIATFDTAVNEWLQAGGQDVLNEVNAWYQSVQQ